jgi:glycosyltransferase involved in cell wall biosynthesis
MPLISVIIPAYNAERSIGEAIGSVLAQTWRDFDVVVVDDGSADGTAAVVREFDDPRIVLVRQGNRGQSAALNRGVAEARGEFIKFLDADDWLNPEYLAAMHAVLGEGGDQVAACGWGYFVDDPQRVAVRSEHANQDYADPLEWLVDSLTRDEGMMGGWKWLIPRTVWDRAGGWDERLGLNNDFDFSIRLLLAAGGVRFAPNAIYAYRKGVAGGLSGTLGRGAMLSAYQTTEAGCRALLAREDSGRIRRICADRWQEWLFKFYPEHPELAVGAQQQVTALGGSTREMPGGRFQQLLLPVLGWRRVRRVQSLVYRSGWGMVLRWKARRRASRLKCEP